MLFQVLLLIAGLMVVSSQTNGPEDLNAGEIQLIKNTLINLTGFQLKYEGPITNMSAYLKVDDDGKLQVSYGRGGIVVNKTDNRDLTSMITNSFWTYKKCQEKSCAFHPKDSIQGLCQFQCIKQTKSDLTYIVCYFGKMLEGEDTCSRIKNGEIICHECPSGFICNGDDYYTPYEWVRPLGPSSDNQSTQDL